jgi:hypothetical protein
MKGYHQLVCIIAIVVVISHDVIVGVLEAGSKAGVVEGVGNCTHRGVEAAAGGAEGTGAGVGAAVGTGVGAFVGTCDGTGVVPVDAGVRGAGVEDRVCAGEGVGSVVLRHRSLRVSFGALATGAGGRSSCDCWKLDITPLDSSDEVSLPSGVESESKRCKGERRFRVREA